MSKDLFYFSRNDRIVALLLLAVIVVSIVLRRPAPITSPDAAMDADTVVSARVDTVRPAYRRSNYSRSTVEYRKTSYSRDTMTYRRVRRDTAKSFTRADSTGFVKYPPRKQSPLSPLDLNAADSAVLVTLPGIGPVFASRIIRYREQLGGFSSTLQLMEINGLPDSLMEWFIIGDTIPLNKILVNQSTVAQLRSHPYLNFYQARAIVEFRRDRVNIKGPGQLSLLEEFTAGDLERLEPYLDYR